MTLIIRKATIKDLDSILELSDQLLQFHNQLDSYYTIYSKYEDHQEYYKDQLTKKGTLYIVAEKDKQIVGFASAYIISIPKTRAPKIGVLVANFVKKEFRGKGIGSALYQFRMKWFNKQKVQFVEMNVDARNKKALKLWKKFGFEDYQVKLKKKI
jgi:ribosomal protein S18 acetylase RimI-like enzyme